MQASFQRLFPNISNPHKFGFSCLILENNVLMHQCAISAKDIKINSLSHPSPSTFVVGQNVEGGQTARVSCYKNSILKIQRSKLFGWYHLHDCAMAHQRYIFQGSEGRYPLKEEVKVDDGLRKLAFLKPNIKLDNGSEWDISLRSHFLSCV